MLRPIPQRKSIRKESLFSSFIWPRLRYFFDISPQQKIDRGKGGHPLGGRE